ncbi:unnamed protein product [Bemisia tabaci]|uniref:Major facilitator superfamily (MFS) profile domain-containing protein n=2 Tax=Bemisia tabaci TaxID=7038 RepID=A0A9P0CD22_BEMTA|nr:PREDICTED: uncharacterized protein LOC109042632 [Bemisia tabaci]XP_018915061.1 PREDICTED: uncharacterized protein LOC109042632 [Bemisia tabaci]CAH0773939.1 unnamed protein product [Bemisia tabaci]
MMPVLKKLSFLYNPYVLTVLTLGYLTSEMGHFMIGVTSKATATDTHYGDIACQYNMSDSFQEFNFTLFSNCDAAKTEEACANLTLDDGTRYCEFAHNGKGVDYQIIAGPSFIAVYSIVGIFFGILADKYNRVALCAVCFLIIGVSFALTGAATSFWQLLVLRMILACGEAGVNPLATGILSDIFNEEKRALVLSLFNWGIYAGIGLSYPVGRYITELDLWDLGWRTPYYLTGVIAFLVAIFCAFTLSEPKRKMIGEEVEEKAEEQVNGTPQKEEEPKTGEWKAMVQPRVLMLFVAAAIRHTGGLCFTYNADLFYREVFPDWDLSWMLFFVTFIIGAIGVVFGGMISDKVVEKYGTKTRVAVLAVSQLIATPFAFGSIYMGPIGAMVTLAISYLFAEMWFGILFAILVEVVPLSVRSTTIGVFLFVMNMVGGNLPILVEPVRTSSSFADALAIFYAGAYLISSVLFGLVLVMPGKKKKDQSAPLPMKAGIENGGFTTIEKIASPPYSNGVENGYPYESHHL